MITLENVSFAYEEDHTILDGVTLALKPGSFHFLTGASGAGKTTLLSLLSLTKHPTRGYLTMDKENVTLMPRAKLPHYRRRIGKVAQEFHLLSHLTVAENVALPLKVAGESEYVIAKKVEEMIGWIGIGDYRDAYPHELSGGQQQRVAIARAVMNKPELILADEPTGNLDPQMSLRIIYLFEALNQMGTTVLIATHDEHLISLFNYPVLRLREGKLYSEMAQAA